LESALRQKQKKESVRTPQIAQTATFYPIPAKDIVTFKKTEKIECVDIYESTGRKLKSIKLEGNTKNI
jgi:hypothetical protein